MANSSGCSQDSIKKSSKHAFTKAWKDMDIRLKPQFLRKLGFPDSDVDRYLKNNDLDMFQFWKDVDENDPEMFQLVRDEVYSHKRNEKVDQLLTGIKTRKSFRKNRRMAWFIYGFCQIYHIDKEWKRIMRQKFQLEDFQLTAIENDYKENFAESQYRMMVIWMKANRLNNVRQTTRKLEKLNLQVPGKFSQQPAAESSTQKTDQLPVGNDSPDGICRKIESEESDSESSVDSVEENEVNKLVKNKQTIDMTGAEVSGSIVGVRGDVHQTIKVYNTMRRNSEKKPKGENQLPVGNDSPDCKRRKIESEESDSKSSVDSVEENEVNKLVNSTTEKLRQHLKTVVGKKCGAEYGRAVDPVDLVLVKYTGQKEQNERDPQKQREKLARLVDEGNKLKGDITVENMFERASTVAGDSNIDKKSVGVVGAVGVGKSTLTKVIVQKILDKKILSNASLVFYITVGSIDLDREINLFELLFSSLNAKGSLPLGKAEKKKIINFILQDPNTVVIIDALDEATTENLLQSHKYVSPFAKAKPMALLFNILNGNLLENAYKLVTSRITQFLDASPEYRPKFVIEILGLASSEQKKLATCICGEEFERVWKILQDNHFLLECCVIPVNMLMTLNYLLGGGTSGTITLTGVYIAMLNRYIRSKHCILPDVDDNVDVVRKLCDLAFDGFNNNKALFSDKDLKKYGIPLAMQQKFVATAIKSNDFSIRILQQDKVSYFVHRSWQELLVALRLVLFMPQNEFESYLKNAFESGDLENVVKFCFGICRDSVLEEAKLLSPEIKVGEIEVKRKFLGLIAESNAEKLSESVRESYQVHDMQKWFHLYACLNELASSDVSLPVAKLLPTVANIRGSVFSSDITNMAALYKLNNATLDLKKVQLSFVGNALQSFGKFVQEHKVKIETFMLYRCPEEQLQFVGSFLPHVEKCSISSLFYLNDSTDSTKKNVLTLANSIKDGLLNIDHPHQMKELMLHRIPFGVEDVSILSSGVHKVADLYMWGIGMTSVGAVKLGQHLEMETTQSMVRLDINGNNFGDIGACAITKSIHKMLSLRMADCGITCEGIPGITQNILNSPTKMLELNLSCNPIGDPGAAAISKCLHNIKSLGLGSTSTSTVMGDRNTTSGYRGCEITSEGISHISSGLLSLKEPMEFLDLSYNKFGDDGASKLSKCLHQVKRLDLHKCGITSTGVAALAGELSKLQTPMESLNLSYNKFGDDGASKLSKCLHQVKRLDLHKCGITSTGVAALAGESSTLQTPMEELQLDAKLRRDIDEDVLKILQSKVKDLKWEFR